MKRGSLCLILAVFLLLSACGRRQPELPQLLSVGDPEPVSRVLTRSEGEPVPTPTETSAPSPEPSPEPTPGETEEPGPADGMPFVGSRNSGIYHRGDCPQARNIKPENLVGWENAEKAEAAGRTPCRVCSPERETERIPLTTEPPEEPASAGDRGTPAETPIPEITDGTVSDPSVPSLPAEQTTQPTEAPESSPEPSPETQTPPVRSGEFRYVGSRQSDKYHDPDCRYARKIEEENLLGWNSVEEAETAGYSACKVCKPH